jgi:hypothetical protein
MLMDHVPTLASYSGVDVTRDYKTAARVQRNEVPADPAHMVKGDPRLNLIVRPRGSHELGPLDLPKADFIFVDGDHSWRGVVNDTLLAAQLVNPGGIIAWHDYHHMNTVDVRPALHVIKNAMPRLGEHMRHVFGTWIVYAECPGRD